jgi:Bacteriophage protein GP30.3
MTVREAPAEVGQATARYKGVDAGATVTRIVETKDGSRVILFSSGDKVIEIPTQPTKTEKPDGRVFVEQNDGQVIESRIKSLIPLDEKPLNVASGAGERIGKLLSNFAERPFVIDGKHYASVEAFYQGLKWPDPAKRAEIASLYGKAAKSAARGAPRSETFEYEGDTYRFGSGEHHRLIKRAIHASLDQNKDILKQFVATHPRPIEHKTGRPENLNSAFPGTVFTRILTELRAEFMAHVASLPCDVLLPLV